MNLKVMNAAHVKRMPKPAGTSHFQTEGGGAE